MSANPIFIMSSERSGSNLLRTLIANHSQVSGPRAPHLLDVFADLCMYYDTSKGEDGYLKIVQDMIKVVNHPYYGWDLEVSAADLCEKEQPSSFLDCFQAIYNECARSTNSEYIICKENRLFDYAIPLFDHFKNSSFIYLYRDPRDYTRSWLKQPMGINSLQAAANTWSREQIACIRLRDVFELPVISVSYENLIEDPAQTMKGVLGHIGIEVESECFSTQKSDDPIVQNNEYWKNLNKPIDSSNKKKYKQYFEQKEIERVETAAKEQMVYLGYDLDTSADWTLPDRGFYQRVFSVMSRAWGYFRREVFSLNEVEDTQSSAKTETEKMISSVISLRNKVEYKRKKEWCKRKGANIDRVIS